MKNNEDINKLNLKLPKLNFYENPIFPNASVSLDLLTSKCKGRYVVANRDIKKGEILFVEKPFAFVLLDNEDSETVCAHCCTMTDFTSIP